MGDMKTPFEYIKKRMTWASKISLISFLTIMTLSCIDAFCPLRRVKSPIDQSFIPEVARGRHFSSSKEDITCYCALKSLLLGKNIKEIYS